MPALAEEKSSVETAEFQPLIQVSFSQGVMRVGQEAYGPETREREQIVDEPMIVAQKASATGSPRRPGARSSARKSGVR